MKSAFPKAVFGFFLAIWPATSFAQAVFGGISGTVTDPSGAALPGAKVTITDTGKGISYNTLTNDSGNYTQSHLTVGNYDVRVEATGFEAYVRRNVRVVVDEVAPVNAQLTVGKVGEVVSVTAEDALLKTEKSDVSDTIDQKTVQEIPIYDRDVSRLYFLVPGIQATTLTAASEQPQDIYRPKVNGAYWGGISFMLDGTDNRESVLGEPVITPKPDALSELKISTTSYDAEFGQASQAVIVAQTKSGSNQFHGSAFDYLRDQHGQAKDPFTQSLPLPGTTDKFVPVTLRNDFGGSIGGPIQKDKMFFFGDYEGTRQKLGNSQLLTVPTAAERGGDLSDLGTPIFDPCPAANPNCGTAVLAPGARTQLAGNVIPTSRISPQALALLKFIPLPNIPGAAGGTSNYAATGTGIINTDSFDVRIDRHQSQKLDMFGRYSFLQVALGAPGAYGLVAGGQNFTNPNFSGQSSLRNQSLAYGTTYLINNNWVADARFGFFRYRVFVNPNGLGTSPAKDAGIPGLNLDNYYTSGMPGIAVNQLGNPTFAFGYSLGENQCNCPLNEQENEFQWVGNVTHTFGNHSLKFGGDFRHAQNLRVPSDFHRSGLLTFDAVATSGPTGGGLGLASFLLGDVAGTNSTYSPNAPFYRYVSNSTDAAERQNRFFSYVQDTWRITPKLTMNYGLRWDIYFPQFVNQAGAGGFLNINTGEVLIAGQNGIGLNGNVNTDYKHFAPRLGIAYQLTPKTVIRAGFGRSYDVGVFGVSFGHNVTQNLPVLAVQLINPSQPYVPVFTLAQGPPAAPDPAGILAASPTGPTGNHLLPNGIAAKVLPLNSNNTMRLPTMDAWNLTIERQLTSTMVVSAAYVGNKEEHVTPGGSSYNTNQPRLNAGLAPTNTNLRRFYFQKFGWTQSLSGYTDDATTKYSGLQLRGEKRFANGLSFQGNYTWASAFDFGNTYFFWDRRWDYGRSTNVRRHVFNLTNVLEFPFGRGHRFFNDASGPLDYVIGGWQFSGVWLWGSGLPFTPSYNECSADIDTGPCRPNLVSSAQINNPGRGISIGGGPVENPWFVVTTAGTGNGCGTNTTNALNLNGCTRGPWQRPGVGSFGNVGLNSFYGPRFFNADASLSKRLRFTERVNGQFRAELFNVFNDVNAGLPNGNVDSKTAGQITGLAAGSLAQMRRWQFGLRVEF